MESGEVPFMLKSKRIEYTLEYFTNLLGKQLKSNMPTSLKDEADQNFANEIRFLSVRMLMISNLVGLNVSSMTYLLLFRNRLKLYVSIPLTIITFFLSRNYVMKSFVEKIYLPMEPIYEEIRRH